MGTLTAHSDGTWMFSGSLDWRTTPPLWDILKAAVNQPPAPTGLQLDFSAVTHADTSAVALVTYWLAQAQALQWSVQIRALPPQMKALIAISDLSAFFDQFQPTHE